MKYKVGDKVRVISILKAGEKYGDKKFTKCMEKYRGEVVTISKVYCNRYCIKEDYEGWYWTDEMFEGLVDDELTAEETIKIQAEMCGSITCGDCAIGKLRSDSRCGCCEFRSKNPDKVLEVLKQWKKDHKKKEVEVEFVDVIRIIEDTGNLKRCVHEERTDAGFVEINAEIKRVLKDWCKDHDGNFFAVMESRCVVKE